MPASDWPQCSCRRSRATPPAAARCWWAERCSSPCCSCRATASGPTGRRSRTSCWPAPTCADLIAGKARSIAIVAAPLAVIGPLLAATITGEWRFFVAGLGVGVGALLAGTGAAIVQSALVPIAIPEIGQSVRRAASRARASSRRCCCASCSAPGAGDAAGGARADLGDRHRQHRARHGATAALTVAVGWVVMRVGDHDRHDVASAATSRSSCSSVTAVTMTRTASARSPMYGDAVGVDRVAVCIVAVVVVVGCGALGRDLATARRARSVTRRPRPSGSVGCRPDADDRARGRRSTR